MNARGFIGVVAGCAIVGGLLSSGGAVAGARPPTSHRVSGWAAVPTAARGPVARALAGHDTSHAAPALVAHELAAPGGQDSEEFGDSVAVSADTLVVGAPFEVGPGGSGAVYVFHRPASGWAHVRRVAMLEPTDGVMGDEFGRGVAISGGTIVVGASYHEVGSNAHQGAVYVFVEPASGWSGPTHESAELTATDGQAGDFLGFRAVALSGNDIVAGAGYHSLGSSGSEQGAVYVFAKPKSGWSGMRHQAAELTASDGTTEDFLGFGAVGISGNTVVAASGYHQVGSNSGQGAVYVFVEPKSGWSGKRHQTAELTASDGAALDYLGYEAVAISGDAVVAGSGSHQVGDHNGQGAAYVWVKPTGGWPGAGYQTAELIASDGAVSDKLSYNGVAMSGDSVAVDAPQRTVGANANQGSMYVFTKPTHGWAGTRTQTTKTTAPDGEAQDLLGEYATAVFGTTVVAGDFARNVGTNDEQGVAYVFAPPRPSLSALKESQHSWRAGSRPAVLNPAHKPKPGGTRFSFAVNEAGPVTLRVVKHGHSKPAETLTFTTPQGRNALYFYGRVKPHKSLSSGKYSVSFSTANSAGTSTHHALHFTVTGSA